MYKTCVSCDVVGMFVSNLLFVQDIVLTVDHLFTNVCALGNSYAFYGFEKAIKLLSIMFDF